MASCVAALTRRLSFKIVDKLKNHDNMQMAHASLELSMGF